MIAARDYGVAVGEQKLLFNVNDPFRQPQHTIHKIQAAAAQRREQVIVVAVENVHRCIRKPGEELVDGGGEEVHVGVRDVADDDA